MRVIVESPFAGGFANVKYGRECVKDCINRGESPFAAHLLYTQKGLLDDRLPDERRKGIDAAYGWLEVADYVVVYMDLGITPGMVVGIVRAARMGKPIKLRWLKRKQEETIDAGTELRGPLQLDSEDRIHSIQDGTGVEPEVHNRQDGLRSFAEIITGTFKSTGPDK